MIYGVRGKDGYVGFSLMWSDDLKQWTPEEGNPIFGPPDWALPGATCKDVHLQLHDGVWLLYYITMDREGYCCVALMSTTDWRSFEDHGCVFRSAPGLPPNYVPALMRGSRVKGPLLFWSEGVARTGALGMVK